ncbi:hypothetical protein LCI18_004273 [Fusarium solani-melongenae]|uniref:Uncharacterized protein n=1 Tax=Fusarium solani subsp. cucurbitae TaxID=2747967 RepID=A0ACD3YWH0_FUSSC|nr:hypothetical protein LCI18_004273 [Fusarium solani-melongenae]
MTDIVSLVAQANARGPTSGFTDVADADVTSLASGINLDSAAIFKPLKLGDLVLKHRVVHAALGRSRSANATESPLAVEYFKQRTTPGGLMISQATGVGSPEWNAWPWAAGLKSHGQADALKRTISAVHEGGGFWFQQLTHVGRCTSPSLVKRARDLAGLPDPPAYGYRPVSSSAVAEPGINTHSGEPFGVPHALTVEEIGLLRDAFRETSRRALDAGADGIEILAGNGFLLDQFLHDNINQRIDQYGGTIENRSRFILEVVDAVAEVFGYQRIGVRLSPFSKYQALFHETDGSQPLEQILHLARELALRGVAFIHVAEGRVSRNLDIAENLKRLQNKGIAPEDISLAPFRRLLDAVTPRNPEFNPTVLIGNGGYTAVTGVLTVEQGSADAVSFGRRFISNPDLVERLKKGYPLTPYDRSTFYTHGAAGYTTYSKFEHAEESSKHDGPEAHGHHPTARRVAVIGAGVSGILTANAFRRVGGFELSIFERRGVPGGSWVYDETPSSVPRFPAADPRDIDPPLSPPAGELPITTDRATQQRFLTTPTYEYLEANIPWKVMAGQTIFEDVAAPRTEGQPFLAGSKVSAVVSQVCHTFDHLIEYNTTVENVTKLADGSLQLTLRKENQDGTDRWYNLKFDHIVVAAGHNSVPRVPEIPGLQTWKGSLRHSATWRSGSEFAGQRILVVGSSESAIDLCVYSKNYAKGPIYLSQRTPHPRYPNVFESHGVKIVTTIDSIDETRILLSDGTVLDDVDTIVFATGYFYSYPFLSKVRPLQATGGRRVPGLYQHIFDIHNPDTIAFTGVINGSLSWSTWEKSAFLVALLWSGKIRLPPREVQEKWETKRLKAVPDSRFHILPTQPDRILFWDELNELAAGYLSSGALDDTLLRPYPYEWVIELLRSREYKLKHYGLPLDVDKAKISLSV